ncbi:MAG: hypothetical protein HY042_01310 [Spirochaetia bacterium]|nr:hypothetical protein [Spirochaetia bacterium]
MGVVRSVRLTALLLGAQILLGAVASGVHAIAFHTGRSASVAAASGALPAKIESDDRVPLVDNACPVIVHAGSHNPAGATPEAVTMPKAAADGECVPVVSAVTLNSISARQHARGPPVS